MRVLIADSDEFFLELLQSYLWGHGHEAEIALDGLECITVLRDFVPDVVLLERELRWGGSDGVMAWMWDDPTRSEIPVILIADKNSREDFDLPANQRVVGWLQRPFRFRDLLASVDVASDLGRLSDSDGVEVHDSAVTVGQHVQIHTGAIAGLRGEVVKQCADGRWVVRVCNAEPGIFVRLSSDLFSPCARRHSPVVRRLDWSHP
ncbi:MAG: hypothetical protein HY000_35925 [Planctomycetes bacterium]|nr:hypothetical protein [Planctomycetota bacterium]